MYHKLQWLMAEKHFYTALKTLEQLEHSFLPRVRGYIFSELLADDIPRMRESIEKQSRSELTVSSLLTVLCVQGTLCSPLVYRSTWPK